MPSHSIAGLSAMTAFGLFLLSGNALAQQKSLKDQLIGTWTLVSNVIVTKDGKRLDVFGANPKGIFVIQRNGHYATFVMRPDLPKVAANDRLKPTAEEAMAIARGMIAYYGTYAVDEPSKTMKLTIDGTTFPNQLAVEQKRTITSISADELKVNNLSILGDDVSHGESVWKRVQ